MNWPSVTVSASMFGMPESRMCGSSMFVLIAENPERTDARPMIIPATIVNVLIRLAGVGFAQLDRALSTSNALIKNAPPKILTSTAKISSVYPEIAPMPPINNKMPGTPKKNLEYLESYAIIFRYFPNTAYEYSTLLLTLITTRCTETIGTTFCIIGITDSSSSPSDTITAPFAE